MLSVRKQDPTFIEFVPRTAEEAVDRYVRCKNRGLKAYLIPECLIQCASGLNPTELEKFERFIINPDGYAETAAALVETTQIQTENARIFEEAAKRVEDKMQIDEIPPLPVPSMQELSLNQEDEKMECKEDDEKLEDFPAMLPLTRQVRVRGRFCMSSELPDTSRTSNHTGSPLSVLSSPGRFSASSD